MTHHQHPRTVVVTGASAGVGRATACAFARLGDRLGLIARGRAGLEAAKEDCERLGAPAVSIAAVDVADADAVERAAEQFERELGPIDVWVNDAMESVFAFAKDITPAEFKRVTEVNYLGYVYGTLAALKRMLPRDHGTIVHVGSALAYRGIPAQSAYCASKHAIQGFQDSLRAELLADGSKVRSTMVQMPALNTPQFGWVRTRLPRHPQPVPPIYQPEVAARAVVWAAEHGPRELNVGATTVLTRWANKLMPGLLDRYLARSGAKSQQTEEEIDLSQWEDNLDSPVDDDEDHGAHGVFDQRAKPHSKQLWAATHKPQVGAALAAAGVTAGLLVKAGRSER